MMKTVKKIPELRFPEFEGEWVTSRIGDLTDVFAGGTPSTLKSVFWNGNIRWMNSGELNLKKVTEVEGRITDLGLKNSSTRILPKHCILIGLAGQGKTRGTAAINMIELCTNQSVAAILPQDKLFDSFFLFHNIDFRYDELRNLSTGEGGRGGLNLQIIKSVKVSLPTLPEQQKIASFLSSADQRIQLLTQKKEKLEQYKKGIMQQIFSQQLRFKDENGKDYPEWGEKRLGDCLRYEQPTKYLVESVEYSDNYNIPVITAGKTFILGYTDEKDGIFKNDLPIILFDDFTTATQFVNFPFKLKSSAAKILLANDNLDIKFIYELMQMIKFEIGGHGRHWISVFSNLIFDFPIYEEQQKIASFLSSLDEKISLVNQQIELTRKWKQGLLQKMFV